MNITRASFYASLILVVVAGIVNHPALWTVSLLCVVLFIEARVVQAERGADKALEERNNAMGLRLIEGINALTDLCKNAFDHLKSQKQSIDKINAKLGDHTGRIHRLDQRNNRVAGEGNKKDRPTGISGENERDTRPASSHQKNFGRRDSVSKSTTNDVRDAKSKPKQGNGQ